MGNTTAFVLAQRKLSGQDMLRRRGAATGTVEGARANANASFNGHPVTVSFKPDSVHGPCWNAEYWWAGRVVLARGTLERCLEAARHEYDRGARGASVVASLDACKAPESVEEQRAQCIAAGMSEVPVEERNAFSYARRIAQEKE